MSLADQASLLLIPSGYKESKIYSVFPTTGVGDFTFNRNSSATRIAKNGLITSVATDIPRLEYPLIDGVVNGCPSVLLEPQRTNLISYSEDFSNAAWTKDGSSVVSDAAISPDGSLNAFKLVEDSSTGSHSVYVSFSSLASSKYTFSAFIKKGERYKCSLADRNSGAYASFNLNYGTVIAESGMVGKIEVLPNDWYKLSIVNTSATTVFVPQIFVLENSYTTGLPILLNYSGDGTSGVYIFGAQLEQGSYPTSYIKSNSGSATTRSAETANGAGDATTFNDSEGVLMIEMSRKEGNTSTSALSLNDGTISNNVTLYYYQSNRLFFDIFSGVTTVTGEITNVDTSNLNKIALKYKTGDISFFLNGFELVTKTNAISLSGLSEIKLNYGDGSAQLNGSTKQIQYFNTVLTDSELEQLTSWTSFTAMAQGQQYSIK